MKTAICCQAVTQRTFDGPRLRALISAETVDRTGEVLLAAGCELASYRRNPVMLWAHNPELPPIGRALEIQAEAGVGVWAVNEFAPTPFAQEIHRLYRDGFLHAFSVGFRPLELDRRQPRTGQKGPTITRWELLEQSAVAVPANADALTAASADGNRAAQWLLKTWYAPLDDAALLARLRITGADAPWPELAAGTARFFGCRGGVDLSEAERPRLEQLLRRAYDARGKRFPEDGDRPTFFCDEPFHFEEHEIADLAALLRGRAEALRNIARKRRRRGEPLPELDPVRQAVAHLNEVVAPDGAPSAGPGPLEPAVADLRSLLERCRDERRLAIDAALDDLRRGAIGGR